MRKHVYLDHVRWEIYKGDFFVIHPPILFVGISCKCSVNINICGVKQDIRRNNPRIGKENIDEEERDLDGGAHIMYCPLIILCHTNTI
jgi:hypothetical protein